MKKRAMFLTGKNQYGVLSEMMGRLADYLEEKAGYEVYRYEFADLVRYKRDKEQEWDFIFSALGVEFNLFSGVDGKKHVAWLVDHPIYHLSRFGDYEDKNQVYIGCVDRTHVAYLKEQCGFKNSFFLPHIAWESESHIPYGERKIDVFFPASYSFAEELVEENREWLDGPVKIIVNRVIDHLLQCTGETIEEGLINVLRELGETDAAELAAELESKVGWYIDSCVRRISREDIVKGLLHRGIRLTVCGRNWKQLQESLPAEEAANLIILSEDMPFQEIVERMADSKIVLNIIPEFKDGTHERVTMGTMNGAVCVTDRSRFLESVYKDQEEIVFYDKRDVNGLADKINWLLSHASEAAVIAAAGRTVAKDNFTVENIYKWADKTKVFAKDDR